MGHTIGDANIVIALATTLVAYLYFEHVERQDRFKVERRERVAARRGA